MALAILFYTGAATAPAADWPQWRGPNFNGSTDETDLPEPRKLKSALHWSAELPGEGASTPVVAGGRVFLTSTDRATTSLHALCLDLRTGRELWRVSTPNPGLRAPYTNAAAPSPIADGDRVFFLFGTGDFFATDLEGGIIWRRDLFRDFGTFSQEFLYGASPLLWDGRLYLSVLRHPEPPYWADEVSSPSLPFESFLLGLDPATGRDLFKSPRPSIMADGPENHDSYATPLAVPLADGAWGVALVGAGYLSLHDARDGAEIWRLAYPSPSKYRQRIVPTPVLNGDLLICARPRYGPLFAVGATGAGERAWSETLWEHKEGTPDTPSPLLYQGRLYFLHDSRKTLSCLDAKTGGLVWTGTLGGDDIFHASPAAADGHVYCLNRSGQLFVVEAGDKFKISARLDLGGKPAASSVVIANGTILVRTADMLRAFGR
jgi:outer membrane protein assembly factor BamB